MNKALLGGGLAVLARAEEPQKPHLEWTGAAVSLLGSPSPDGRWLSFMDPATGALSLHDLKGGPDRVIAERPPQSREFAYFSTFDRSGDAVAYAWSNASGFYELRMVGSAGGAVRILFKNEQVGFVQPCAFTPGNKQILTLLFRRDNTSQIALVPVDGGAPRVLRSLNWVYPKRMDVSPDGRWLVYDNLTEEGSADRGLFLLSMDGAKERRISGLPRNSLFPLWSADGRAVYFTGDDGGAQRIYRVGVVDGVAAQEPGAVSEPMGRLLLMGMGGGRLFFGVRTGAPNIFIASLNGEVKRVNSQWSGRNTVPAFSADGRALAYLSRRGAENFGQQARSIVVNVDGKEREIDPKMAHVERLAWSPDGGHLLVAGSDGKGRSGLFLVRVSDGATTPLVAAHDGPFRGYEAVWSVDGKRIYLIRGDSELVEYTLAGTQEKVLLKAAGLRRLAISPDGATLAVSMGDVAIRLTPLQGDAPARIVSFPGLTDLAWGRQLLAGRRAEIWTVPLDGAAATRLLSHPERQPGMSTAPDGRTAFYGGVERNAVFSLRVP